MSNWKWGVDASCQPNDERPSKDAIDKLINLDIDYSNDLVPYIHRAGNNNNNTNANPNEDKFRILTCIVKMYIALQRHYK